MCGGGVLCTPSWLGSGARQSFADLPHRAPSGPAVSLHQAGNDFLPHVPSIDIYDLPSGLDLLLAAYKELLPDMKGCITQVRGGARRYGRQTRHEGTASTRYEDIGPGENQVM